MPSSVRAALFAALLSVPAARALASTPFASEIDAIELRPEVGTGIYGYEATGNLGVLSLGVREFDRRWLVAWDGDAELVAGAVAYEYPFYPLYGAQGQGEVEGGWRALPARAVSPWVGALVGARLSAVTEWGVPFGAGAYVNNLDGLGGVIGSVGARLGFGGSLLRGDHSLLFELQPLAEVDSAQANVSLLAYFGGALRVRYDWRQRLTAMGEVAYAVTPAIRNAALDSSSVTGRWSLSASAVKKLGRWSLGLGLSLSRTDGVLAYAGGQSFTSAAPLDARLWLLVGFWP